MKSCVPTFAVDWMDGYASHWLAIRGHRCHADFLQLDWRRIRHHQLWRLARPASPVLGRRWSTGFCPSFTPPPYLITRGQVLAVLPFGNVVVTLNVNGAELKTMLENGVSLMPSAQGRFPQVSGLCFSYDIQAPAGSRVTGAVRQAADGSCTGAAIDLTGGLHVQDRRERLHVHRRRWVSGLLLQGHNPGYHGSGDSRFCYGQSPISPAIQGRVKCTTSGAILCPVVTP